MAFKSFKSLATAALTASLVVPLLVAGSPSPSIAQQTQQNPKASEIP